MSLLELLSETVTWLRYTPGLPDAHGVPMAAWVEAGDVPAYVEPTVTVEVLQDRDTVTADYLVVVPAKTKIAASDRLLYRKLTLEVVGEPGVFHTMGGDHHIQITARSISG